MNYLMFRANDCCRCNEACDDNDNWSALFVRARSISSRRHRNGSVHLLSYVISEKTNVFITPKILKIYVNIGKKLESDGENLE